MRIRVPVIGTGAPGDGFRCDLPCYQMVEIDYGRGIALVDVPDDDVPDHPALRAALGGSTHLADADQAPIGAPLARVWHDHLDARYKERAGRWRPQRK